ncbi:E coli common pilus chaperone EcpB [Kluyvera sp. M-M157-B]
MNILLSLIILLMTFSSYALDVGDISSFIYSDASILSKEIKNNTDNGRFVNVSIQKISSPLEDGKIIQMDSPDEMLLSPASILIPSASTEVIHFFYKGPEDNQERYYRIFWQDQLLSEKHRDNARKSAVATVSAKISTLLIVAPRHADYRYKYQSGVISNAGNATLKVIAYGVCADNSAKHDCKEDYYLMPGRERVFTHVNVNDPKGHVALWQAQQFVPVK